MESAIKRMLWESRWYTKSQVHCSALCTLFAALSGLDVLSGVSNSRHHTVHTMVAFPLATVVLCGALPSVGFLSSRLVSKQAHMVNLRTR